MRPATEAEVVHQYLKWHSQYGDAQALGIVTHPNLTDGAENDARWKILAHDKGHAARVRYPFFDLERPDRWRPYRWSFGPFPHELFAVVLSTYGGFVTIDAIAQSFYHWRLIILDHEDNAPVIESNIRRLAEHEAAPADFNAMILCRPTPGFPPNVYRVVEGSKRAIAVRAAQLRGLRLPPIDAYWGEL